MCWLNKKIINFENKVNTAILGTIAKNEVTIVGEPSYTSGDHIWKGAAANLNKKPIKIKDKPIRIVFINVKGKMLFWK